MDKKDHCKQIFSAAVTAVHPKHLIPRHLQLKNEILSIGYHRIPLKEVNHIYVTGAGKASAAMAHAVEEILENRITAGLVVTKYGHALKLKYIQCIEAAHPVPDENSLLATLKTIETIKKAGEQDIIICLISGGASALWADAPKNISLADMQAAFRLLLDCGASIDEVNTVRKHLSIIKGGQLLRVAPSAKWFSFIISDVPGDKIDVIASGPTIADPTSFADVQAIVKKYSLEKRLPAAIIKHIKNGLKGIAPETLKPNDPMGRIVHNQIIGSNAIALKAAKREAESLGYDTHIIHPDLQGDAASAGLALFKHYSGLKIKSKTCFLTGGETTVAVTGNGKGGRNQHLALSFLQEMIVHPLNNDIAFLSAGTDGTDGPTDAAGAIIDSNTVALAQEKNLNPLQYLANYDSWNFFEKLGALIKTGPTQTNVMDITVALAG